MLIDWFTVGAQVFNFLVLVALLKIFLYDRVLSAMDTREKSIGDRLNTAEEKQMAAEHRLSELNAEKKELADTKRQFLADAKQEVQEQKEQWRREAREEIAHQRKRWANTLTDEKRSLERDIHLASVDALFAACDKVLARLADVSLEERICAQFLSTLKEMDADTRRSLSSGNGKDAVVTSRFELPSAMRRRFTRTLHAVLGDALEVSYETDPRLLAGIELKTAGKKIPWHAAEYLKELGQQTIQEVNR